MAMQAKARCLLRRIGRPAMALPLQRRSEPGKVHVFGEYALCVDARDSVAAQVSRDGEGALPPGCSMGGGISCTQTPPRGRC